MSNEEFESKIDSIVERQVQFADDIQQLREVQTQLQATQVQTEQVVARLANVTLEGFKDVNAKIDALVDSQIRLNEAQLRTDENVSRTDGNLRNLIAVVDRYSSQGRNGR
jgi:division protein CdvB (Snf7/Vps24/ESCRT-III family)